MSHIDIGLSQTIRAQIIQSLSKLLAETYLLYLKTQNFHWNVTGPHFKSLHELFEVHYIDLAEAIDTIAERIRALGEYAPGSFSQYTELSEIKEERGVPAWQEMVNQLVFGHETLIRTIRSLLPVVGEANDEGTLGLLGARLEVHEKTAWMLRSLLA